MNRATGFALYNQGRFDDETFVADFVARNETLDVIRNMLRVAAGGGETEHLILIGARGMGKTSLLRRVAIAIGAEPALAETFAPLRFREEQYNVIALDAFWRNCGEALAEWCEVNGHEAQAEALDQAIETPEWRDADKAATAFLAACAALGRRACLLIDNLDLILDNLDDQQSWSLRHVLQRPDGPIVIGAATQYLSQGADRGAAFYEFFHPLTLDPLSEAELIRCMRALADRRGPAGEPVRKVLTQSPERIRTLYALTGGNPRILTLIYQLLERADTSEIFADLEALLDQVTPFYKARIEEYGSAQQRAVIDAVGLHWDPISSGAVAEATGIAVTTISPLLIRLRKDGLIEQVPTSGARDGYQFSERFLNIWYLMRHGTRKTRQRLKWLTKFLARLFSPEELNEMAARARGERDAGRGNAGYYEAIEEALIEAKAARASGAAGFAMVGEPGDPVDGAPVSADVARARELLNRWQEYFQAERFDEALPIIEELLSRFDDSVEDEIQPFIAVALFAKGFLLSRHGRADEALAAYNAVDARFGASDVAGFQEEVVRTLLNKGVRLGALGHSEEAIEVYDLVDARFGASDVTEVQEKVARALVNKGFELGAIGRFEEAIEVYDLIDARFGASDVTELQVQVAKTLFNKGARLGVLGRFEEAIEVYDMVDARFGASDVAGLHEPVARALVNKGVRLDALGRSEEAIEVYDLVDARFGASDVAGLQEQVARALVNKGLQLGVLGRSEEEIEVYDLVDARFGASDVAGLQDAVATALLCKGLTLEMLDRNEVAIATYDAVDARFGARDVPTLQEVVATALFNKGDCLNALDRSQEALAICDAVDARFGSSEVLSVKAQVTAALLLKSRIAISGGDYPLAEASLRRVSVIEPDAFTSGNLAWALIAQGKVKEARDLRASLPEIAPEGLALIDAGIEFAQDNLGNGFDHLATALAAGLDEGTSAFFEDLIWLLRIGADRGHGERLIEWFAASGNHERYAPINAALIAYVRGERFLLDVNPEVRGTAQTLLARMAAHRPVSKKDGGARKPRGRKKRG